MTDILAELKKIRIILRRVRRIVATDLKCVDDRLGLIALELTKKELK